MRICVYAGVRTYCTVSPTYFVHPYAKPQNQIQIQIPSQNQNQNRNPPFHARARAHTRERHLAYDTPPARCSHPH